MRSLRSSCVFPRTTTFFTNPRAHPSWNPKGPSKTLSMEHPGPETTDISTLAPSKYFSGSSLNIRSPALTGLIFPDMHLARPMVRTRVSLSPPLRGLPVRARWSLMRSHLMSSIEASSFAESSKRSYSGHSSLNSVLSSMCIPNAYAYAYSHTYAYAYV